MSEIQAKLTVISDPKTIIDAAYKASTLETMVKALIDEKVKSMKLEFDGMDSCPLKTELKSIFSTITESVSQPVTVGAGEIKIVADDSTPLLKAQLKKAITRAVYGNAVVSAIRTKLVTACSSYTGATGDAKIGAASALKILEFFDAVVADIRAEV